LIKKKDILHKYIKKENYGSIKSRDMKEIIGKENIINWNNNLNIGNNQYDKMDISFDSNIKDDDKEFDDKFLPCREEEQLKIYNFIKNGLKTNGNYNSLYIGGMPGTGKTECIQKVIEEIEIENKENNDTPFRVLFVNCVNFPKTSKIYKFLYNFIFSSKKSKKIKATKCIQILDNFFNERNNYNGSILLNDPSNTHIILVLDEIDYLINKNQYLLYYIFNWTTYINSQLIVISLSNLLNISNHLRTKIISRMGQNKIMFKPYNKEQIRKIISYKGINLEKFDEDALKLSSMKVAALNGDLRRVILILNKAKELFDNDIKKKEIDKNALINKFYIVKACNELFDGKITNILKNFKITEKLVISALLFKSKDNNNYSIKLGDIYDCLYNLVYKYNEYNVDNGNIELDINWNEFQKIIYNLLRIKIIELCDKEFINFKDNYVHIKFYIDEFMLACQFDEEYKPIFSYLADILN
jgi:origin recognition complex subunit 1